MAEQRQGRILVIDDNPQNLAVVQGQLERSGYTVVTARSGRMGLEAATSQPPDLVLLDIMMPGLDGYEVCRRLKADPHLRAVPVVMLTSLREQADKLRALNAGADDFLSKPVDRVELETRVRAWLRMKRMYDELAESRDEIMQQAHQIAIEKSRAEAVLYSMSDGVFTTDLDGRITFLNPSAEAIIGVDLQSALGERWRDALRVLDPGGQPTEEGDPILTVLRTDQPVPSAEMQVEATGGQVLTIGLAAAPIGRAVGRTVGVVAVFRDITERRRSEEERVQLLEQITRERAVLAAVTASMTDGLVVLDTLQHVRYCNAPAAGLVGLEPQAVVGKHIRDAFALIAEACTDPEGVRQAWRECLARIGERPSFEFSLAGPPARHLLNTLFPVQDPGGSTVGFGMLMRDMTVERDLARTKDELVSVVSHELRTPLASLVGFVELLLSRDYSEPERREFLSVMHQEGQRLTALINDFLDLQRMESASQQPVLEPTDLRLLVERVAVSAGQDPQRPIVLDVPDDLPLVRGNSDRILQVLANLLSNARKYSPQGGEVQVTARALTCSVRVCVRDQGLGLPPEALPLLFEKFYRVDNSDRRAITGTGLGLAICRRIVEGHGGRIWAESEGVGKGATFCFALPRTEVRKVTGEVLVVEDDPGFARLLEAELAARGLSMLRVASAEEALEAAARIHPRALMLDLLLPKVQGEELLARVDQAGPRVPVVITTVKDLEPHEQHLLERLGAVAVLRKGPGVAALAVDAVARALADQNGPSKGEGA